MQHNCTHFPDIYYRLLGTVGVLVWCQCECDPLIIQMFWALNVAHRSKPEAQCWWAANVSFQTELVSSFALQSIKMKHVLEIQFQVL